MNNGGDDVNDEHNEIKVVWLGYLNNKLPDGRVIPLEKFTIDSKYDGLSYYDEQTNTKYLIS